MIISLTSVELRSVWNFFRLSYHGYKISRQAKTKKDFVKLKSRGFGYMHYTLSVWNGEDDLKQFAREGAHLEAMRISKEIAIEIRTHIYHSPTVPSWKEAKTLLLSEGKILSFKK
jgi:hypothetical protein